MRRLFALLWLGVLLAAAGYLASRVPEGLPFQSDLMALLPVEKRDPTLDYAKTAMAERLSKRVVVLVGHSERAVARGAAAALATHLEEAGAISTIGSASGPASVGRLGKTLFPYREGLLSEGDRRLLLADEGAELVGRAFGEIYGLAGVADSQLLRNDPLLLFPAYLRSLPGVARKAFLDDGMLTIHEDGRVWVLVSGETRGNPFALSFQKQFQKAWDAAIAQPEVGAAELTVLRAGAIFHAAAGAGGALREVSIIGLASLAGTVLLFLIAFRSARPLVLGTLSIVSGLVAALTVSLLAFGAPHVSVLLFGVGLIGVTVDYSLHYFAQVFTPRATPAERLGHVLPAMTLGVGTTIIGYCALAIAPYPGLRQVALFSIVGVVASFLTVLLWFPVFDTARPRQLPATWQRWISLPRQLWVEEGLRNMRRILLLSAGGLAIGGFASTTTDDDIRRQQELTPGLVAEQGEVRRLTGIDASPQFFIVDAEDEQVALVREEKLAERLQPLAEAGTLGAWRSPASFVPSIRRQKENRRLVAERLEAPHLADFRERLGMGLAPADRSPAGFLTLAQARETLLPFLDLLIIDGADRRAAHIVVLEALADPAAVRRVGEGIDGVHFIDPTAEVTALLGTYRRQAVWLLCASVILMVPVLAIRYGLWGALRVMAPPVGAVVLTPALLALAGVPFTFFAAMGLVLVLAIGVDYAVFCAEDGSGEPATLAAVALATLTTMLSFGLLAFSDTAAVQTFGITMLAGIAVAFLAAPVAARRSRGQGMLEPGKRVV